MIAQEIIDKIKLVEQEEPDGNNAFKKKYGFTLQADEVNQLHETFLKDFLLKDLVDYLAQQDFDVYGSTVITTQPLGKINAYSIKADDKYLVILNRRLMSLISSWFELQELAIRKLDTTDGVESFPNNFQPVLNAYLNPLSGSTLPIIQWEQPCGADMVIASLRTIMCERFVLAHELAHIFLGHLSQAEDMDFSLPLFWETYYACTGVYVCGSEKWGHSRGSGKQRDMV